MLINSRSVDRPTKYDRDIRLFFHHTLRLELEAPEDKDIDNSGALTIIVTVFLLGTTAMVFAGIFLARLVHQRSELQ